MGRRPPLRLVGAVVATLCLGAAVLTALGAGTATAALAGWTDHGARHTFLGIDVTLPPQWSVRAYGPNCPSVEGNLPRECASGFSLTDSDDSPARPGSAGVQVGELRFDGVADLTAPTGWNSLFAALYARPED